MALSSLLAFTQDVKQLKNGEYAVTRELLKKTAGDDDFAFLHDKITIANDDYEEYITSENDAYSVTYNIQGWDKFIGDLGVKLDNDCYSLILKVSVDGKKYLEKKVVGGEKVQHFEILLTGKKTITFNWNPASYFVLVNAKLVKGNPQISCLFCDKKFNSVTERDQHVKTSHQKLQQPDGKMEPVTGDWPYAVDPKDLETLALAFRRRIDAKPELKAKIDKATVALMTFNLIDIPKPSVAEKVAENLSTSLINNDFPLVERGQLDKAFKELRLQATGVIDPSTAKKLGEITGCNVILVGSISDEGQFVVINARFLDTSTGKALAAERVEMRKMEIKK